MRKFILATIMALPLTAVGVQQQYPLHAMGNCFYRGNQVAGCYQYTNGRLWWAQPGTAAVLDTKTNAWVTAFNGVSAIWTTAGWQRMDTHPVGSQIIKEMMIYNATHGVPSSRGLTFGIAPGWSPAEIATMQGDPNAAAILARSQNAGAGVWTAPPVRPWYGR